MNGVPHYWTRSCLSFSVSALFKFDNSLSLGDGTVLYIVDC